MGAGGGGGERPGTTDSLSGAGMKEMPVEAPRRAASLTLRSDELRESRAASMEAANKSLADALLITYRLLLFVMFLLLVLFAFSGFQQVNESERGIKVAFGRVWQSDLEPGFHFSLPYPLGEVIKISTSTVDLQLEDSFYFFRSEKDRNKTVDELGIGRDTLRPGSDGSLITADGNLLHAQLSVKYRRTAPTLFAANVLEADEQRIVQAVVERATVQVAAEMTIDELLKRSGAAESETAATAAPAGEDATGPAGAEGAPGADGASEQPAQQAPARRPSAGENDVEARIRRLAQESLDRMHSGIQIERVATRNVIPPLRVRASFREVNTAISNASKAREDAEAERARTLNEVAGSAYEPLLDLIDTYEEQLDLGQTAQAEATIAQIFDVLDGKYNGANVELNGRVYPEIRPSGTVSMRVAEARSYQSSIVQRARAQSDTFRAKLAQYRANPRVFLVREWTEAMSAFLADPTVETFLIPPGVDTVELLINSDPDIARAIETAKAREKVEANWEYRSALLSGELRSSEDQEILKDKDKK